MDCTRTGCFFDEKEKVDFKLIFRKTSANRGVGKRVKIFN